MPCPVLHSPCPVLLSAGDVMEWMDGRRRWGEEWLAHLSVSLLEFNRVAGFYSQILVLFQQFEVLVLYWLKFFLCLISLSLLFLLGGRGGGVMMWAIRHQAYVQQFFFYLSRMHTRL